MNDLRTATGTGGFPDADWLPGLQKAYAGQGAPQVTVLGRTVVLPPPGPLVTGEVAGVAALVDLRTVEREREIVRQARSRQDTVDAIIRTVQEEQEVSRAAVFKLEDVASYALRLIEPLIFTLKAHFNRARPWHCDPLLSRMFPKGHAMYPGHPSYPSGHSTQAHTVAGLFARRAPHLEKPLLDVAARIALNREIAGLHFPSDSAAGRFLGVAFADAIVDAAPAAIPAHQFQDWMDFKRDYDALLGLITGSPAH